MLKFTYLQINILNGSFYQLLIQVIMTAGATNFVSECGHGWMSLVLRGRGGNRVIPVISGF